MKKIDIDRDICIHCQQCVDVCPSHLLQWDRDSKEPLPSEKAGELCISCNHCVAACPVGAVRVDGVDSSKCLDFIEGAFPRFGYVATLVRSRRSIRRYADKPLSDKTVEQLMDVARWAPSARNGLPVKWLVINDKEKVRELAALVVQWIVQQPGGNALENIWKNGTDPVFRGAPCLIAAYTDSSALWPQVDTAIAVETLDLCAAAMQLGACWAGYFIRASQNEPKINQFLGLHEDETVHGGLMLGHIGNETYRKIPYRPELSIRWLR